MKKIFKLALLLLTLLILVSTGIYIYLSFFLDENFIAQQIESNIDARVALEKIDIGLLSLSPTLACQGFALAQRDKYADNDTPLSERPKLTGAPIAIEKVEFKVNLLPLLRKQFELKTFLIRNADLHLKLMADGRNDVAALFNPPAIVDGEPNPDFAKKQIKAQDATTVQPQQPEPPHASQPASKPFSILDVPISAKLYRIGLDNADIDVWVQKTNQHLRLSGVNLLVDSIDIDPHDLAAHDRVSVRCDMNFSVLGKNKTESKEQMQLKLNSHGDIQPFDPQTGYVNPAIIYQVGLQKGSFISSLIGLQQVDTTLKALSRLGMNLEKLTQRAELTQDTQTRLAYHNGRISFVEDLHCPTRNYDLTLQKDGWVNVMTNEHQLLGNVLLSKQETDKILAEVDQEIAKQVASAGQHKIQIDPQKVRDHILEGLVKEGRFSIDFASQGNIKAPKVQLSVIPPTIGEVLKATLKDALKDNLLKQADQLKLPKGVTEEQKEKAQDVLKGVF